MFASIAPNIDGKCLILSFVRNEHGERDLLSVKQQACGTIRLMGPADERTVNYLWLYDEEEEEEEDWETILKATEFLTEILLFGEIYDHRQI